MSKAIERILAWMEEDEDLTPEEARADLVAAGIDPDEAVARILSGVIEKLGPDTDTSKIQAAVDRAKARSAARKAGGG